jgi:hypothetical protein
MSVWRITCPHCNSDSTVRTSRALSATVREATVQCNNPECAHTWIAHLEVVRTIAPSMTPNPKVFIPLSPRSPAANQPTGNQLELGMMHPPPRPSPSG